VEDSISQTYLQAVIPTVSGHGHEWVKGMVLEESADWRTNFGLD
jgi:hypothetical protein